MKLLSYTKFRDRALTENKALKKEYDRLEPEFILVRELIKTRLKKKISQKELAKRIGTKQSAIARLESGRANPSFQFLNRVARALDSTLRISFR